MESIRGGTEAGKEGAAVRAFLREVTQVRLPQGVVNAVTEPGCDRDRGWVTSIHQGCSIDRKGGGRGCRASGSIMLG